MTDDGPIDHDAATRGTPLEHDATWAPVTDDTSMAGLIVDDELWELIEPLHPAWTPNPRGEQPRKPDRLCLTGILFVLRTGIAREDFPQEIGCCGMTLWNRLHEWTESRAAARITGAVWAGTAGGSSGRSAGCANSGNCVCGTIDAPTSTRRS